MQSQAVNCDGTRVCLVSPAIDIPVPYSCGDEHDLLSVDDQAAPKPVTSLVHLELVVNGMTVGHLIDLLACMTTERQTSEC